MIIIAPVKDWLLVTVIKNTVEKKNGLIIPEMSAGHYRRAIVIATGKDCSWTIPGDKILIEGYGGKSIVIEDEEFLLIKEELVLAQIGQTDE